MPLQPPSPEFLSQAPGPEIETDDVSGLVSSGSTGPRAAGFDWYRPAGIAGVAIVLLAAVFGIDLIG